MAASPPSLPPIQPSDLFLNVTHPLSEGTINAASMDAHDQSNVPQSQGGPPIPPYAPQSPPASFAPPAPQATEGARASSRTPAPAAPDPPRNGDRSRSRSRSPSRSRSSERSGSDGENSEAEEQVDAPFPWHPIVEDTTVPCDDELAYIASREEHSARDRRYWSEKTFFPLDDSTFVNLGEGRIDWVVDHFNGTKEEPNTEEIMRSPIVHIGGCDWRIKFFPKGNTTGEFISVYLECVTTQAPEFAELEEFKRPAFPFIQGEDLGWVKKRRSVAAQLSIVMYNPAEPRSYEYKTDAHRFSKRSSDYGWQYYAHRDVFVMRNHGQRRALLQNDKLAFSAYIRVVDDPTGCMWEHDNTDSFNDSVTSTSLRPFLGQPPHFAAFIPLLHFEPLRKIVTEHQYTTQTVYKLQTILWKLYSRTHSEGYRRGRRPPEPDPSCAVTCVRWIAQALSRECDEATVIDLLGPWQDDGGMAYGPQKLQTKAFPSIQQAVNQRHTQMPTPVLLTMELQRQEFDREKRKWRKLTNRVEVEESIKVGMEDYHIFAFATHCGDLESNKHNAYVRPGLIPENNWYAYESGKVKAMTHKQAVEAHQGFNPGDPPEKPDKRRDSPFSGIHDDVEDEVIYMVQYVRSDFVLRMKRMPKEESWTVPEEIRKGLDFPKHKETKLPPKTEEEASDLPFRAEQDQFEREQREREIAEMEAEGGAATPDWPLTDEEGDVVMSDADDEASIHNAETNGLAASTTLTQIPTTPSRSHKWYTTQDCLGRDWYEGSMLGSVRQGSGHLIATSGDEYVGEFYNNKPEGYGKMIYAATGDVYEGQWVKGQHHGKGMLQEAATGNVFDGHWQEGRKHGQFTLKGTVTEEDRGICTICYEREISTAFYDCGHVVACKDCANRIDSCPICRRRVVGRLQIYGVKMTLE